MGKKSLTWNEAEPEFTIVPRLDDDQIDDLFYQEDEIGEMRHTAFMIECGLEEDPPDGPDVPPIPWKKEDLIKLQTPTDASNEVEKSEELNDVSEKPLLRRIKGPPKRTYSMDVGLEELEESLPLSAKSPERKEPTRKITASKSGSLPRMRPQKSKPSRHTSVDPYGKSEPQKLSVALARTEVRRKPRAPTRGKIAATKSGSLHEMRRNLDKMKDEDEQPKSPIKRASRLVATKSGNLHGMRQSLKKTAGGETAPRKRIPSRGSLTMSKSGTQHGARRGGKHDKNDKKKDEAESASPLSSDEEFLSDVDDSSHGSGDVSIETDASSDDEPKVKNGENRSPTEILKEIKKEKEKKKKKKAEKAKKKSSKDKDKGKDKDKDKGKDKTKKKKKVKNPKSPGGTSTVKKFKVKKANPDDLPPAFRSLAK